MERKLSWLIIETRIPCAVPVCVTPYAAWAWPSPMCPGSTGTRPMSWKKLFNGEPYSPN